MTVLQRNVLLIPMVLLGLASLAACEEPPIERDFTQIEERDTLFAVFTSNSTSYFLYRGIPMGFEYELLQQFADEYELEFRPIVVRDRDSLFTSLYEGIGDVSAGRIVPSARDSAKVSFTNALYETHASVVQQTAPFDSAEVPSSVEGVLDGHGPASGDTMTRTAQQTLPEIRVQARAIRSPADLAGNTVHLPGQSGYHDRLIELSDSITGDIEVVELGGDVSPESLIYGVAQGRIELTVSQGNIAQLNESYFENIVARPTVGPPHRIAWAVRPNSPELLSALNEWIERNVGSDKYRTLYEKYYVDRRGYEEREKDEYLTSKTGRLSEYDPLLKRHAQTLDWDWRLLASQTYQESQFKPRARSWAGAMGLLQLMPPTAREFGVSNAYDPEENVAGAVRFLTWLTDYWDEHIPDEEERLRFILASYNTGHGHVEDARRLTEKHGDDPMMWNDVAFWLLQKSKRQHFTDPVVKYGFCRGLEPVTYVGRILSRFEHYKQFVVDEPQTV